MDITRRGFLKGAIGLAGAKFRGEESNGMLLAAESGEVVSILHPDQKVDNGSEVH